MKWFEFWKEYFLLIFSYLFFLLLFFLFFWSLHVEMAFLILYFITFLFLGVFWFCYYYFKKRKFYNHVFSYLNQLEEKYLIHEMNLEPDFLEANKLLDILFEIDKSMKEKMNELNLTNEGFRDYIEMWIHEIKIPLANLFLMIHNKEVQEQKILEQLKRVEEYIEQVLYYVRSEMVEKDYFIQEYSLKKIVSDVVKKNKDMFIYEGIHLEVNVSGKVLTDEKWLSFILNQLLSNCFKYRKKKNARIIIRTEQTNQGVLLKIWDNGIGIAEAELPRVFDKAFTGSNGRNVSSSTGMGLSICKKLIDQLGHSIQIVSSIDEFTEVTIIFSHTDFYEVVSNDMN